VERLCVSSDPAVCSAAVETVAFGFRSFARGAVQSKRGVAVAGSALSSEVELLEPDDLKDDRNSSG
jgi:hypothetical protein